MVIILNIYIYIYILFFTSRIKYPALHISLAIEGYEVLFNRISGAAAWEIKYLLLCVEGLVLLNI